MRSVGILNVVGQTASVGVRVEDRSARNLCNAAIVACDRLLFAIRGSPPGRRRTGSDGNRGRLGGQALVEFALVIPLFLVMFMAVIEFAFALNAELSINYASRDTSLLAAEAGKGPGADCIILRRIEGDPVTHKDPAVTAPADRGQIQSVEVYLSDQNGLPIPAGGPNKNVWTRTGSTPCPYGGNLLYAVPYTLATTTYPEASRCNISGGCTPIGGPPAIDTIGVKITYAYTWHTPLGNLLSWVGTGLILVQSNASRMEPVL